MGIPLRKRHITFAVSAILSIVLMYYLYRDLDFSELFLKIRNINRYYLLGFFMIFTFSIILRALRYWVLIGTSRITFYPVLLTTIVRNMFVDFLPARIGSISYIIILRKKFNIDYDVGTASLGLSIFFDTAAMFPLLLIAILYMLRNIDSSLIDINYNLYIAILVFINLVFFLIIIFLDRLILLAKGIIDYFAELLKLKNYKLIRSILDFLDKIFFDIIRAKKEKTYALVFLLSLFLRIFKYVGLYLLLLSIVYPFGLSSFENLNFFSSFLGTAITEMSEFLPIKGIAGIGTWHAVWAYTFDYLNILDFDLARNAGLILHSITQLLEYFLGVVVLLYIILLKSDKNNEDKRKEDAEKSEGQN